jgi:hypothetical protein
MLQASTIWRGGSSRGQRADARMGAFEAAGAGPARWPAIGFGGIE